MGHLRAQVQQLRGRVLSGVERLPRHTFGQFQPLDPGNPQALGAYRLWFYERENYARHTVNDHTPCYEGRC